MPDQASQHPSGHGSAATVPPIRRLLAYALPYLWPMLASLLLILATTMVINALPMILQRAIDRYLVVKDGMELDQRVSGLWNMGGWFLGLAAVGFAGRMVQGLLTAWIGQSLVRDLRRDVFDKTLRLGLPYFERTPVGAIMTRVTSDVDAIQRFVTEGVVGLIADVFMLLGIAGYMVYLNPRLAGIAALFLPPLVISIEAVNRYLRQANRDIRTRQSELNSGLREQLAGMSTIQLFNREQAERHRFDASNRALRNAHFTEVRWFSHFFPIIEIGQNATTALLVGVGGWLVMGGTEALTVGMLVAFLAYIRNFFWPLAALSDKAGAYQQAMAAAERIFELLGTAEDVPDPPRTTPPVDPAGEIRFENVWFAYEHDNWILRDFNLRITPGESVAVVGSTGAGKTTLINLLMRFYDVGSGKITVNGHDIRSIPKIELRRRFGLVLQEPCLFAGTVADNISLGDPAVNRAAIERAAKYVNADRFIRLLPEGYDTELRGRGGELSSGEKQLLAMARALIHRPEIALLLDEATANVDTGTEILIQQALRRLTRGQTTIAIAHRLSTIRDADRILVMQNGMITSQGSHTQLMTACPYYRHLVNLLQIIPHGQRHTLR